ncbi:MAG: hypothetical protein VW405_12820 [Rhodospirillaceae bacterium]
MNYDNDAEPLENIARAGFAIAAALHRLGNGNASDEGIGAIEGLSMKLGEHSAARAEHSEAERLRRERDEALLSLAGMHEIEQKLKWAVDTSRELRAEVARLRAVRDTLAETLRELECGWWATGTVPEMMEAVRVIVRAAVDKAAPHP